jgi:hypothetical protein
MEGMEGRRKISKGRRKISKAGTGEGRGQTDHVKK